MLTLLLVLRVLHILGGVFWAGSSFLLTGFVEPTVRAAGDDGARFMQRLSAGSRFSTAIAAAAGITVLAGLWLMWIISDGFSEAFFATGRGIALNLGMWLGLVAFVLGFVMQNRPIRRMTAISREVAAAGAPPTPAQAAELTRLSGRARLGGRLVAGLLLLTVILMAVARYVPSF
jgi:uncharacterized membrane protein